jgi:hypothetical protein
MHHLAAFRASVTQNVDTDLAALPDQILTIQNGHFLPQQDLPLLFSAACSTNLARARLITPSFRGITTPYIRPVSQAANFGYPQRLVDYSEENLVARRLEELQCNVFQAGTAAENVTVLVGLLTQREAAPMGPCFTLRGTSTTAATSGSWSDITVTWADVLPQGTYAVIGAEVQSTNALASRIIFENSYYRPGGLSVNSLGNGADKLFRFGGLGTWGRFNSNAFPNIQVLAAGADAAHEVYLDVVKL